MYFLESLSMTCTYGMMIRIILESSSPVTRRTLQRDHAPEAEEEDCESWIAPAPLFEGYHVTCVEARETVQNASNNGRLSEVNAMWMRYI